MYFECCAVQDYQRRTTKLNVALCERNNDALETNEQERLQSQCNRCSCASDDAQICSSRNFELAASSITFHRSGSHLDYPGKTTDAVPGMEEKRTAPPSLLIPHFTRASWL